MTPTLSKRFIQAVGLLGWPIRLTILCIALSTLMPPPPRAILGDPQTVETTKPLMCVHTRLIDEVDEWKIQQTLIDVREMGAGTIVEFFPWAYIEPGPSDYHWESVDRIVRHAQNQGIHIIARLGLVPAWARDTEEDAYDSFNTLPPDSYDQFADFTAAFAARYAGVIDHLIIWNEPNLAFEWGYRSVDPAGYLRLLQAVYPAIKAANPNAIVLAAPLAPTLEPEGSPNGLDDLVYLDQLYALGAANYFDALAIHTYGFTAPADAPPAPDQLNFRRAELLRDVMIRHGDDATPAYITETGWNDSPRWTLAVTPSLRIQYTLQAYEMAESWDWLRAMCLWVFRFPSPTFSYPDSYTLVNVDFRRKPIYFALQAYARGLAHADELWLPDPNG